MGELEILLQIKAIFFDGIIFYKLLILTIFISINLA